MNTRFKHWLFENHFVITISLLASVFAIFGLVSEMRTWAFISTAVGSIVSVSYFGLQHHLQEVAVFKDLFTSFNERYDAKNEALYGLLAEPLDKELSRKDEAFLFDYFNLCAEEYLYYKKGYIYPEVWEAWRNGMAIFYANGRIKALWDKELGTESYYGLTSGIIMAGGASKRP